MLTFESFRLYWRVSLYDVRQSSPLWLASIIRQAFGFSFSEVISYVERKWFKKAKVENMLFDLFNARSNAFDA